MKNQAALDAFNTEITGVSDRLYAILNYTENKWDTEADQVNYGHVADAKHVNQLLDAIAGFLGLIEAKGL